MIESKDPTESEIKEVYGGALVPEGWERIGFQQMLLAANTWAKAQNDVNGNKFAAAFWNGEMRRDEAGNMHYGIMCIRQDIVSIWTEKGVGEKEPSNSSAWFSSNDIAVNLGYLAGFWDGNRTWDGTNWAYNVVCIKEHESVEILRSLNETSYDEFYVNEWERERGRIKTSYQASTFREAHRWVGLPDSDGTPSHYVTCLPLFKVDKYSEGYVSYRLAFK